MCEKIRIDKMLSEIGVCSRKEAKQLAKKGHIFVNDIPVKSADIKINPENDNVKINGKDITYNKYEYYLLNKPAGVVSATEDKYDKTVIDLIKTSGRNDLFPVGRLDKDTVGLMIITNDGLLAHNLLSPSKHVDKTYFAKVEGEVTNRDVEVFKNGMELKDGTKFKPSKLVINNVYEEEDILYSEIMLTITEGKFHQVKRMFQAVGKRVVFLKRVSMGPVYLEDSLKEGEYRHLTQTEVEMLQKFVN